MRNYKKDYLYLYTQELAKSFCLFPTLTNMKKIQYEVWDTNFELIFRGIFDILESSDITIVFSYQTSEMKEVFRCWLRQDFNKVVRDKITKKNSKYMLSRFLLIRVLDPDNKYKLFEDEEWYERCLSIEKKAFNDVFTINKKDEEFIIKKIEDLWTGNDLSASQEKMLEAKLLENMSES